MKTQLCLDAKEKKDSKENQSSKLRLICWTQELSNGDGERAFKETQSSRLVSRRVNAI